jgi:hypothetical protein
MEAICNVNSTQNNSVKRNRRTAPPPSAFPPAPYNNHLASLPGKGVKVALGGAGKRKAAEPPPRQKWGLTVEAMMVEPLFSMALLAGFIWAIRFLLPRAIKQQDWLALLSALLTAALALTAWLMFGIGLRS